MQHGVASTLTGFSVALTLKIQLKNPIATS